MALFHCHFRSEVLGVQASMGAIVPQRPRPAGGWPTLYLLHGLGDDHTIWQRRTSIERYAEPLDLAVVMPAVNRSFYTDMAQGAAYWSFVSEEVPRLAGLFFSLSGARRDNFVAGLSMGGYGAFKWALRHPERFAAAASLSGVLDIEGRNRRKGEADGREVEQIFAGADRAGGEANLMTLVERAVADGAQLPLLYQCCGRGDGLYEDNLRFKAHAEKLALPLTYEEGPGEHDWGFWDTWIQRVLAWLPRIKAQ